MACARPGQMGCVCSGAQISGFWALGICFPADVPAAIAAAMRPLRPRAGRQPGRRDRRLYHGRRVRQLLRAAPRLPGPGMAADLIALSREQVKDCRVDLTMVAGQVYRRL
jgi:hypothetical protein